jgi:hypothetical protein
MSSFLSSHYNEITAAAAAVTAISVVFAFWQLVLTKRIAQLQFEDALAKEYRDIAAMLPTKVFYGEVLDATEQEALRDEFYRYIDLSNEQVSLRQRRRVSGPVWKSWRDGIKSNLALPAFAAAWEEVKTRTSSFAELRRLERGRYAADPAHWR